MFDGVKAAGREQHPRLYWPVRAYAKGRVAAVGVFWPTRQFGRGRFFKPVRPDAFVWVEVHPDPDPAFWEDTDPRKVYVSRRK